MRPVGHTKALARVKAIPRRTWSEKATAKQVKRLTAEFRTPQGAWTLLPHQAKALYELRHFGLCFGGMLGVGSGKTLISFLAARACGARRPLLVVPGGQVPKTLHDLKEAAQHFVFQPPEVWSYSFLSMEKAGPALDKLDPDLVIFDEAHDMKNRDAGRAKKFARWHSKHPRCKVVILTGTVTKKELNDWAHLAYWALRKYSPAPCPVDGEEWAADAATWGEALDDSDDPRPPGALLSLGEKFRVEGGDEVERARRGLAERLLATPGVVSAYVDPEQVGASIYVTATTAPEPSKVLLDAWEEARAWRRPDGRELVDGSEAWRLSYQLSLGFYYKWKEDGPAEWMARRKAWGSRLRGFLSNSRLLDTPKQVERRAEAESWKEWVAWKEIRGTFKPETEAVWISDEVLERAAKWAKKGGVVWSAFPAFGRRLSSLAGLTYYGQKGLDDRGRLIDVSKEKAVVASVVSCSTGHNLQRNFHRSLDLAPLGDAVRIEQAIARFHRPGLAFDSVDCDVWISCREHAQTLDKTLRLAYRVEQSTLLRQKLLLASRVGFESRFHRGETAPWKRCHK